MRVARLLPFVVWGCMTLVAQTPNARSAEPAGSAARTADDITPTPETEQSPWGWLKMPTITMPKINMPKMPADPLAPLKASARKVSDGGKKAWEGTKELFRGGTKAEQPAARVARADASPSFWHRLTGSGGEKKPEEPQTVSEWMAQPRVQ